MGKEWGDTVYWKNEKESVRFVIRNVNKKRDRLYEKEKGRERRRFVDVYSERVGLYS